MNIKEIGGEERITRAIVSMNCTIALNVYHLKTDKLLDIWVLSEIGVEESWTKLSAIGLISRVERQLGFWMNGKLIKLRLPINYYL